MEISHTRVVSIRLKRNVEIILTILKSISIALDKLKKDNCYIADVEIWQEFKETLKKPS